MIRLVRRALWSCLALAAGFLIAGCAADGQAVAWGANAETYFAEWGDAWAGADPYDVVRFYDTDVAIGLAQDYRTLSLAAGYRGTALGGEGRAWLASWIDKQYEPRQRTLGALFVGRSEAVAMVTVEEPATAVAVSMEMGESSIVATTDMKWRDAHLPGGAPDDRLLWLDALAEAYVAGWTSGDPDVRALYAPTATVESFPRQSADLETALASGDLMYQEAVPRVIAPGELVGSALFVGPDSAAIGLEATLDDGCRVQSMVLLTLQDQTILTERRLLTPESVRRCLSEDAPVDGWWNSLAVPPPVDEQVSGAVTATGGAEITIINGTPELERLLEWGLSRFDSAGLPSPGLASVTFAPVPACAASPGRVTEKEADSSDLVLCTDAYRACQPDRVSCTDFRGSDRLGMLHELGHAWLLDNLDEETQSDFLALNGLSSWRDPAEPWHRRGAEQAAEVIAWGLLEQPIALVRIGNPDCEAVAAGFRLLTGSAATHECKG